MRIRRHTLHLIAASAFVFAIPVVVHADSYSPNRHHRWQVASNSVSLDAAVARIQRETGGRVLSASTVREGGRLIHRIKVLLPSGKVRVYQVDAGS